MKANSLAVEVKFFYPIALPHRAQLKLIFVL